MHGLPSSSLPSGAAAVAANGHGDFGFWKPSYSHQEETMFLYECTSGSPAPVREQNYEVMNLFDHIRHQHHHDHAAASQSCQRAGCSECGDRGASVVVHQGHGEDFSNEETRYMNLFTRRADGHIPPSVPLSPLFIPQHSEARDNGSPTLSHNSYSFLPNKQIVNLNGTELPSPAVVISATALVPVPFDHESLVKPSGPIAMLKSPNSPNKSSEGSSAATDKVETKETKEARSVASGASNVETGSKTTTSHHRQRQNSFPAENSLRMPRKYSMPPVSGNLLADTRQNSYDLHGE